MQSNNYDVQPFRLRMGCNKGAVIGQFVINGPLQTVIYHACSMEVQRVQYCRVSYSRSAASYIDQFYKPPVLQTLNIVRRRQQKGYKQADMWPTNVVYTV